MGSETSCQRASTNCSKMFTCWYDSPSLKTSPQKQAFQEPFFFELDVKDLLESNKVHDQKSKPQFTTSTFNGDSYMNSLQEKKQKGPHALSQEDLKMLTCRKQLFTRNNDWKFCQNSKINEESNNLIDDSCSKENQNCENLSTNIKNPHQKKTLHYRTSSQRDEKTPDAKASRLLSMDSDFKSLHENSVAPKTPISQNWRHFLSSINRTKFLNSNFSKENNPKNKSNQSSHKLINYSDANALGNAEGSIPNGYGQIRYPNGDMVCGFFQNNLCEGIGKYIKKDGSLYEGDFLHGQAHGKGVYLGADGYRYQGQWKNNQPQGEGKATFPDYSTYQGSFLEGKKHGNGCLFQNGCKYAGQFKNDKLEGTAIFEADNGQTYSGQWKMNQQHGFGEYKWPNGDRYVGNYKNGRREGYGVMYYQNGDIFSGDWKNGMKNGKGIFTVNNTTISGSWIRSKLVNDFDNS